MEKKIGLLIAVISSVYFLTGCRTASVESDSFIVSTPLSSYNSDIITLEDTLLVFLYDTLPVQYYFNFPDTIGGFRPRCIVDSFVIEFFDQNDVRITFVHNSTGDSYDSLHFEVNTEVEPNTWFEGKVDLVPSWLKAYYNPIYNMHQGNPGATPQPLKTRAHYTFFAHEMNTKQEFITEFDITVVFANFADEQ
jgi:hypothetical protein